MILLEAEDPQGNKAKIEVTEFKSLADAAKVIRDLKKEVENLKTEIQNIKNGANNGK